MIEISPAYCDVIRKRYATFVNGENCDWVAATPPVVTGDGEQVVADDHAEGAAGEDAAAVADVPDTEVPVFAETE
jgi:hypothetical protein